MFRMPKNDNIYQLYNFNESASTIRCFSCGHIRHYVYGVAESSWICLMCGGISERIGWQTNSCYLDHSNDTINRKAMFRLRLLAIRRMALDELIDSI